MTRFFLDRVWQWCKSLENRLGYNRITEALCARLTWWVMPMAAKQALKTGRPTVFVTCWMPAYLSNIEAVLDDHERAVADDRQDGVADDLDEREHRQLFDLLHKLRVHRGDFVAESR